MSESSADILVVGAGPTGLLIAGDLAGMGHRVEVLEKRSSKELNLTRAFSIHARAMDQLAIRGLAPSLIDSGIPVKSIPLIGKLNIPFHKLHTSFPFMLVIPQYVLERKLRTRAEASDVKFSYGLEADKVEQSSDIVRVSGHDAAGNNFIREAHFVVGADGLRSAVRAAIGVDFPGEEVLTSVIIADVKVGNPPLSNSGALGEIFALRMATSIAGIATRFGSPSGGSRVGKFWDGSAVFPEVNCHLRRGDFVLLSPGTIEDFGTLAGKRRVANVKSSANGDDLLLIRPDGYIAWQSGSAADHDRLAAALQQCVPG